MLPTLATRRGLALLLGLLCLALATLVYGELQGAERGPVRPAVAPPAAAAALLPQPAAASLSPIEAYDEVLQRPLFSATRRPPPAGAATNTLGTAEGFALIGIIIAEDGRAALIQHGRPPVLARLHEGQALEGWTVAAILPDRVVLEHDATQHELKLKDRPPETKTPAGPIAPPPRGETRR